jgi:uncharacterized protein involved in cysteine biosynthesis
VFTAFARAFAQLSDPAVRRVVGLSLAATILLYAALVGVLWWLLGATAFIGLPWAEMLVDVLGGLAAFALALLLFPAVVSSIAGVFLDDVADAVEARHYPGLPPPRRQTLAEGLTAGMRLGGLAVLLNLLVLPLYFIPLVNLVVFYALNGYLLSREYFEMVALRRATPEEVFAIRRRHRIHLWLVGAGITVIATVPFLNMLFPVIGTAAMVHVSHRLSKPR